MADDRLAALGVPCTGIDMNTRAAFLAAMALTSIGCPTVDLGEELATPGQCRPDREYFDTVIWPQYLTPANPELSCTGEAGCHRRDDGRSALRLIVSDGPLDPADLTLNYQNVSFFLNCGVPDASALLTEPLAGVESHGGGDLFAPGSDAYNVFLQWFEQ